MSKKSDRLTRVIAKQKGQYQDPNHECKLQEIIGEAVIEELPKQIPYFESKQEENKKLEEGIAITTRLFERGNGEALGNVRDDANPKKIDKQIQSFCPRVSIRLLASSFRTNFSAQQACPYSVNPHCFLLEEGSCASEPCLCSLMAR